MSTSTHQFRYWAFISYSSKDADTAEKLLKRLETYRIPRALRGRSGRDGPVPKKLFPIFRDRDELPLSADLGGTIKDALRASRYLIVLCSPHSAQSRWVNEEISYFKSLGREDRILAIILDGEPNASDHPNNENIECFPAALRYKVDENGELTDRRVEPIGGDLREGGDGWNSVFLKAVAGITGLGYNTFAKREQKRRRIHRSIMAAVGLVVLLSGFWVWDYYRKKTIHYANMATTWSLPVGIGKLDSEMRKGRQFHYRFTSSEWKIRRVERMNSAGTLRDDENEYGASVWEIVYNEDGTLQHIDLRDHNGKHLLRKKFAESDDSSDIHIVKFLQQHHQAPLAMSSSMGDLNMGSNTNGYNKSEITAQHVRYDDRGRIRKLTYHDSHGKKRAGADNVHGQYFLYEDAIQPIQIENLGFDGKPARGRGQIVALKLHYNKYGDLRSRQYLDANDRPVLSSNQVAGSEVRRDTLGNLVEGFYFGIDKEPVLHKSGKYHRWTQSFDERGNRSSQSYFGIDEQPVLHSNLGAHTVKQDYDDRGNVKEQAYYGIDGDEVIRSDLEYHLVKQWYDNNGNVTEYRFFGVNRQPVLRNDLGAHRITAEYDESGSIKEQAYFGIEGDRVRHKRFGYHRWTQNYDKRGNITNSSYFGTDGEPVLRADIGVHRWEGGYDERGNLVKERYYDIEGDPVLHKVQRIHGLSRIYDKQGNLEEVGYFGTDQQIHTFYCAKTDKMEPCSID